METIIRKAIIISGMTAILAACLPENSTATVSPTNSLAAFIQKIAFVSARDGNDEIYIMNSDGSEQTNLSNSPANEWFPSWSPDGNKIVFMSDRTGHFEIYVMNADGSDQVQLTNTGTENSSPAWGP